MEISFLVLKLVQCMLGLLLWAFDHHHEAINFIYPS